MPATLNVGKNSRKRILLVDDEPFSARTLRILLTIEGYEVETAVDGPQGLALATGQHDLVIVNLRISATDGRDLAQEMQAQIPALPIIVMVGGSAAIASSQEPRPDGNLVLVKSWSWAELKKTVAGLFASPGAKNESGSESKASSPKSGNRVTEST